MISEGDVHGTAPSMTSEVEGHGTPPCGSSHPLPGRPRGCEYKRVDAVALECTAAALECTAVALECTTREGGEGSVGRRNERHCLTTCVRHEAVTIKAIVSEANEAAAVLIGLQLRVTLGEIDHPLLGGLAGSLVQEVHVVLFPFLLGGGDLLLRVRAVVHFDH